MDILIAGFGPAIAVVLGGFPILMVLVLLAGLAALMRRSRQKRRRQRVPTRGNARTARPTAPTGSAAPSSTPRQPGIHDPATQLLAMGKVGFERQRLLNRGEYRVLAVLERYVRRADNGHRVMAQTVLGEIIRPMKGMATRREDRDAQSSINSKRVDMVVIDRGGFPLVVVEVQGAGHYQGTAYMRDAVKREALRRAGVAMLEIDASWSDEDIERRLASLVGGRRPGATACRA